MQNRLRTVPKQASARHNWQLIAGVIALGQKQQLSLADVMVLEPELLLLDEPTAFLSPGHCRDLRACLDRIHAGGTTIVVATHDLDFLHGWADWLLVMDRGQLVMQGPPLEVLQRERARVQQLAWGSRGL